MDVYRAQGAEIEEPDWQALRAGRDVVADEEAEYERLKAEHKANPHLWTSGRPDDGGEVFTGQ